MKRERTIRALATRAFAVGAFAVGAFALVAIACGNEAPYLGGDGGPDGSADGDADIDGDADADSDADSDADIDGDADSDGDTGSDSACGEVEIDFEMQTPTVVLLIDQSGSMSESFGDGDRWTVVRDSLLDADDGVVAALESVVRFGVELYTSHGGDGGGECPILTGVDPALDNYDAIHDVFFDSAPDGDTPTGESIAAVAAMLAAAADTDEQIIVLATDGEPDTCEVPNPQTGQAEAVDGAEDAFALGFRTYIISVGDDISLEHMQAMANAGAGTDDSDPAPYYQALDQDALVAAFEEIVYGVRDCELELEGAVQEGMEEQCVVEVDGAEVPYDDPDGWTLEDPSTMLLLGATCEAIQTGDVTIDVECPCGAVVPE